MFSRLAILSVLILAAGCRPRVQSDTVVTDTGCEYAGYFSIIYSSSDSSDVRGVVSISPYNGDMDTLYIDSPMDEIVCMSTSGVASLAAVGADSAIVAVSGLKYISDPKVRSMGGSASGMIRDIGYESSLDYETILGLSPDVVVAYTVGSAESPALTKLRRLGLRVFVVYDHMEHHPLARAEYVKLFGAMTGRLDVAEEFFADVRDRYLCNCVQSVSDTRKVLLNIPYADVWYVPGEENYMSRLIRDAGGEVLGAATGSSASGSISLEEAYRLSLQADVWLCPGHCRSRMQLSSVHHLFPSFGPLMNNLPIYNNTRRSNPAGGNDFYESGSVRPDLILQDLRAILSRPSDETGARDLTYFISL